MSPGTNNSMSCIDEAQIPEGGGNDSFNKSYDYLLKFLLVGDSDVGKHEILQGLKDGSVESPFCVGNGNTLKFLFYAFYFGIHFNCLPIYI